MLYITGVISVEVVIYTTVRVNDRADWVCIERKKNRTKETALSTPNGSAAGCESVLPTLTDCILS